MRPLALAVLVALGSGCDSVLGIEDLPRAAAMSDASTDVRPVNDACVSCATNKCGAARVACVGNDDCASLLECVDTCGAGEVLCRADCERAHGDAARSQLFRDVDLCRRKECVADCYGLGGFGAAFDPSCTCMNTACADEMRACVRSGVETGDDPGACDRRLACMARKPTPEGYVECVTAHGGGAEADALLDCMLTSRCPIDDSGQQCSIGGGAFSCLQNFTYEPNTKPTVEFSFGLENLDHTPVVGALVVACSPAKCGPGCDDQGHGTTGPDGRATFDLKLLEGAFDGCLYIAPFGSYMGMNVSTGRRINGKESITSSYALFEDLLGIYADDAKVPLHRDDSHGHVLVAIHDCLWRRVAGASLNMLGSDPDTRLAYFEGLKTLPDATATSQTGAAAYINVPVGKHEIVVTRGGEVYARQTITVRARELTDVNIYPRTKN